MKFTPEQIIDQLYGPPKKAGQKKLEDFKKKEVPKPEKPKTLANLMITAEDQEGKEIVFDLEKVKAHWLNFYQEHQLEALAQELEQIDINLTDEQVASIQEKAKEGFNYFQLCPSIESQQKYLNQIKQATEKELAGLDQKNQYDQAKGTYLYDSVQPNFPDQITTLNRPPNQAYLVFLKDQPEVDDQTRNQTPIQLRQIFEQKQETGWTLAEYLLFQRDYTQRHLNDSKPHPETQYWTWLLDSELAPASSEPGRVLRADWGPGLRRVGVHSRSADGSLSSVGARSSAIFEI